MECAVEAAAHAALSLLSAQHAHVHVHSVAKVSLSDPAADQLIAFTKEQQIQTVLHRHLVVTEPDLSNADLFTVWAVSVSAA